MREEKQKHTSTAHREKFHFCFPANTREDFSTLTNMPDKNSRERDSKLRNHLVIQVGIDVNYLHMQGFSDLYSALCLRSQDVECSLQGQTATTENVMAQARLAWPLRLSWCDRMSSPAGELDR